VPTYQYACTACGHKFEAVQSFSDASLTDCPECAGRLRKVFSSVGIVFKGSGFYRTDSRAKESAGSEKSEKKAADPGSSGGDAGSTKKEPAKADSGAKTSGSSSSSGSGSSGSGSVSSTPATAAS
jgi:putative FmdB family regulatory protein